MNKFIYKINYIYLIHIFFHDRKEYGGFRVQKPCITSHKVRKVSINYDMIFYHSIRDYILDLNVLIYNLKKTLTTLKFFEKMSVTINFRCICLGSMTNNYKK